MNEISIDRELEHKLWLAQHGKITWREYNSHVTSALRRAFPPYYAGSNIAEKDE